MDRGAWWASFNPWGRKQSGRTEHAHTLLQPFRDLDLSTVPCMPEKWFQSIIPGPAATASPWSYVRNTNFTALP